MRARFAAAGLVLLLARAASAQTLGTQPPRGTVQARSEVAAQASFDTGAQATFDTSYLLALYMMQLQGAGTPPTQADIDEAARQYFTNGAVVTAVPTSGPGAAYYRDGASVMAYRTPSTV